MAEARVTGAPPSYFDDGRELKSCPVCLLDYCDDTDGFHTLGCTGCDPDAAPSLELSAL